MKSILPKIPLPALAAATLVLAAAETLAENPPLPGWRHSGAMMVLTTPEGADLPAGTVVEGFPLLVRLSGDWFDFTQARPDGADLRFTAVDGTVLPHQIEEWDAKGGRASIWVRIPRLEGQARLPLQLHWGRADAGDTSDGRAVFGDGYLGIWHLNGPARDALGTLEAGDTITAASPGIIGQGRHFPGGTALLIGDKIGDFPAGDAPHTTELWFRAEKSNVSPIGWGNNKPQGKVVMQLRGTRIHMDCWFSDGSVDSSDRVALGEWCHAVYVYEKGNARLYINGVHDGGPVRATPLNVGSPCSLWLGGWLGAEAFAGDLDEVRLSRVARSAEWVRLQYENQKPLQTLAGPLMREGVEFEVTPRQIEVREGGRARITARVGGAQKVYWSLVRDGNEQLVAVDRFTHDFDAPRVAGDTALTLRLKAVRADGVKTLDIPIAIRESMPDPEFTLEAPSGWDGRTPLEITPRITNQAGREARMEWAAGPAAVTKEVLPGALRLLAAQKDGPLTVTATLSNGGTPVSRSVTLEVKQPAPHIWVERVPAAEEKPEEGQFYARDDSNQGTLHYNGTLEKPAAEVFLKVFADDRPFAEVKARPGANGRYALSARLKPGLVKYRIEFGTREGAAETVLDQVGDLVCGDAFLIEGQSNAEALDLREERPKPRETSDWIRTYGGPMGRDNGTAWMQQNGNGKSRPNLWCRAVWAPQDPDYRTFIGWWGMELGKRLVASQKMPVFILNGALGGTRVDQHQRNAADPADLDTIYGRWLWRLRQSRLTHGIRAIIWHQGENDQPADNPMGRPGHEIYQPMFLEMAAGWQRDLPNARHYYLFQIWPNACAMGGKNGAGDRLREAQRTLPGRFDNLSILSTLGIRPPGGCHFPKEGYDEFARLLQPLIERDLYGKNPGISITPPNLLRAAFATAAKDTLTLEFDQPVLWDDHLTGQFYLDGEPDQVAGGTARGRTLTLKLKSPSTARHLTYLKEANWKQETLLLGENGLAALTFCEVPIAAP